MELLNDLFQNVNMGILGIDEVLYKIKNIKLKKLIIKEKKEYNKILKEIKRIAKINNYILKDVNIMAKMSSEIVSEIKIMKTDDSDKEIIKMMIEGTYKSLGLLTPKVMINEDNKINELGERFIRILEDNIKELKNI